MLGGFSLLATCTAYAAQKGDGLEWVYFFNHIHSSHSGDNPWAKRFKLSPKSIMDRAHDFLKDRGLRGVVAITDHNATNAFEELLAQGQTRSQGGVAKLIRAMEWGSRGHLGLIGLPTPEWTERLNYRSYRTGGLVEGAKSSGAALRVVNHPYYKSDVVPREAWASAEAVEVMNGSRNPFEDLKNSTAIKEWAESVSTTQHRTALAGTDFHFKIPTYDTSEILFYPANIVIAPSNNPEVVLQAIKQGRVTLQMRPEHPFAVLQARWSGQSEWQEMGSKLSGSGELEIRVLMRWSECKKDWQQERGLTLFLGKDVVQSVHELECNGAIWSHKTTIAPQQRLMIRAELGQKKAFYSMTNPIYVNH